MSVKRDARGQIQKGSDSLNPGGRATTREQTFGKSVWVATGEGQTLRAGLMEIAGDAKHKDRFNALRELLVRCLGTPSKVPFIDEDATPEFTQQELLELAEGYVAQAKEKTAHEVRPDERAEAEVSAVQPPGPLQPGR